MTEDEMVGWHHWLDGHEFEKAPGVGDGQGVLVCCSPRVTESQTGLCPLRGSASSFSTLCALPALHPPTHHPAGGSCPYWPDGLSVLGFTGSCLAHLNLSLSSLRASPPPLIYSHAATDYLLSLWVLLCLLWTRLIKSLLWLPVPDCTAHISGLKDLRVWPQPFSTLFSTWFHQHHLDSLPVPGHAYLSSSLPAVPCLATCGHKGDLAEPCLLRPNTAFLCILFLSYLEVVLHCIFVEVSGAALGTGMSILGSADATPSVFPWALPSPVLWSEAWPSSGKSWSQGQLSFGCS